MLLRRLVKVEPQLFEGMRPQILDAVDGMIVERGRKKNSTMVGAWQRWLHLGGTSPLLLFVRVISDAIQQIFSIMSKTGKDPKFLSGDTTTRASGGSGGSATATTTTPQLSPQPGQNPTVFFLPGLEATPLHDCVICPTVKCPCSRLWTKYEEEMKYIRPSIRSKTPACKIKRPPVRTTMGGDVEALRNGCDVIRRELLEFLLLNKNCGSQYNPFQPFDPKVYTHAISTVKREGTAKVDHERRRHLHQQPQQQPEWSSIYLYHRGILQSNLCKTHFPQTLHILETQCSHRMAGKCGFGSVYFSKLGRNTKVKEHCGPTNLRWRCHLPLIVPAPPRNENRKSHLRVGLANVNEKLVGWEEGKPILFDDSFLHSAVHHGDDVIGENDADDEDAKAYDDVIHINSSSSNSGARIVLIVDFWHPSLSESDRTALGILYPPGS
ncbi:hypothetical protein ACHAW5_003787 [Stephanodiscus triporus]|uniref:Aspartyl/asparaginy/proline hydroxylase domain-containing protein n=1 Tax=Stephanodiscus triporus TaxID=2934178 RepID=A0ABD3QNX2_9STRA